MDLNQWFHYPEGKSPQYKEFLKVVTIKYGNLTTLTLVGFIILIPIINTLIKRGYYIHNNFKILRWGFNRLSNYGFAGQILQRALFFFYYHLSTIIQICVWFIIFSGLSLSELHNGDLIILSRRLGRIALNSLTPILFLTIRPSPLPNTLYLGLLPIHKWLSRFIILELLIHTVLYMGYFVKQNTLPKMYKTENIYGWISLFSFLIILVTSLLKLKNRFYKVFYTFHYTLTWVIVLALQVHVRPTKLTNYTIFNLCILLYQIINRKIMTKQSAFGEVKVHDISPNLLVVEFPNKLIHKQSMFPGSHVRLTKKSSSMVWNLVNDLIPNYHPYTLVSLPNDLNQKLIIRKGSFQFTESQYLITGSYDPNLLFLSLKPTKNHQFQISKLTINTKRVLIVVGGSAISFALPILRCMNYHGIPIKIVWVIKDFRDIAVLKFFDGYIHGDDFEIFVTGSEVIDDISNYGTFDLESGIGQSNLLNNNKSNHGQLEDENVDISVYEEEEEEQEDSDCYRDYSNGGSECIQDNEGSININIEDDLNSEYAVDDTVELSPTQSLRTTTSSGTNEHFMPKIKSMNDLSKNYLNNYRNTVDKLNISNKIYKGRPKLNYRYYNWCLHDGFTQCTGPVEINSNLVCCKDLPHNNVTENDASKVWVLSAGPIGLVNNAKVWSKENGLKFHEEAFYS